MTTLNILDSIFWHVHPQYRRWTFGDPKSRPPVLSNWHPEDLAAYCGGQYTTQKGVPSEGSKALG